MSDDKMQAILATLERLEAGQATLSAGQAQLRVDLMARMDRMQDSLTGIPDDIAVAMGAANNAREKNARIQSDIDYLSEQAVIKERQIQRLQTAVRELKGEP